MDSKSFGPVGTKTFKTAEQGIFLLKMKCQLYDLGDQSDV